MRPARRGRPTPNEQMCVLFIPRLKKPRLCWLLVLETYRDRDRTRARTYSWSEVIHRAGVKSTFKCF